MLVGDVRWARTGFGSSWKLSGGSPPSAGPRKASKNRQVRRAVARRVLVSCADRSGVDEVRGGRLTHREDRGDTAQRIRNGAESSAYTGRKIEERMQTVRS